MACSGSCTALCAGNCTTTCAGFCAGGCRTICGGSCSGGCTNTCLSSCTGTCASLCTGGCSGTCHSSCTGTCSGGCSGCGGDCSGSCTSCSGCSGGCTSCSGCAGTCTGTCNNACVTSSSAAAISNIGANILAKGKLDQNDFKDLLNASVVEYTRRGYSTSGRVTSYTNTPAPGVQIFLQHAEGFLSNLNAFPSSGKNYTINSGKMVLTSDLSDAILYIRQLMNTNIMR